MASYVLSTCARHHLKAIYRQGYLDFGEQQADIYYAALRSRFENIAKQPLLYPSVDYIRIGYRRSVCQKHSIFYRVVDDTVEIMAILRQQHTTDYL